MLEKYKMQFGADVTIFFNDTRALTTITDGSKRIIGTKQDDRRVLDTVLSGDSFKAGNILVDGKEYYVCYIPLFEEKEVV